MLESFIQKFGAIGTIQTFIHEFEKLSHNNFHKRNYPKTSHNLIMNEKWTMMVSSSIFNSLHNEEKRCFAIGLATQLLSCNDHLQLIVFLHCECYRTSCMNYRVATHYTYGATHCNSIATMLKPLIFNYYTIPLQFSHNSMLMLVIFIHRLKLDMWHYEIIWILFFLKY
jgi:hypothetical protein